MRIATLSSEAELAELEHSWDDLVLAMPRPSPYLLHGWLLEWWRHYADDAELAVHVAYRGDRLVAALPLCVRRRSGLRVLEFVGGTWAILADVLEAPGEAYAGRALVRHAASSPHDFADLFGLPGSSRLVASLPPGSLRVVERLEAPVLDLTAGWDAVYNRKLSSKARSERRRRMRQLAALGPLDVAVARTPETLGPALEDAFRVHRLRWQGLRDPTGFVTETGVEFHRAAIARLAEQDIPRLAVIRLGGTPIAFALSLQLPGRAYGVTMAYDPAYARYGVGFEAKLISLQASAGEGVTRVELLGADAPHKRRLTDRREPVYQAIGLAQTRLGRTGVAALLGGIRVRRALKRSRTARRVYARLPPRTA